MIKNKFVERYNNLFEDMESSEASDEQKNFVEWNQKMNEFLKYYVRKIILKK